MEVVKRSSLALLWIAAAAVLSQYLVVAIVSSPNHLDDQKNYYYTPDPSAHPPPAVRYSPPPYSSGGGHASPTPSHGGTPPANCGRPPSGGSEHRRTSPPSSGSGYNRPPPTSTPTPPTTPITRPSPPFALDPNSPPFTCDYWRNHPTLIWGLYGWLGTVGAAFGGTIPAATGANMNLLQALSNTRTDGIGELYREGAAALLNSMAHARFPYTTNQVRDSFVRALSSNKAAAAQAQLFKMANEGRMRPTV